MHTVGSEMEKTEADLRQVVVLSKSEWQRVQDSVNGVNHHNRSVIAAAEQREALHMRSKELVKHWSNTIAVSIALELLHLELSYLRSPAHDMQEKILG